MYTGQDSLVIGPGSEELAIRAEANAAEVEVARLPGRVLEYAGTMNIFLYFCIRQNVPDFLAGVDVEYLGRSVAASREPLAVGREADLAGVPRDGVPGEPLVPRLPEVVRAVHQNLVIQRLRSKVLLCQESVDKLPRRRIASATQTYCSGGA